eukprot:gb/GECG01003341.1/.p1 GENE.gb/GECG01003341.1/~~gb/GECG01003341.1/.p1  ORF type:complete len:106 (+),score=10.17 gb/GECG01003341.1/:1-318(+)
MDKRRQPSRRSCRKAHDHCGNDRRSLRRSPGNFQQLLHEALSFQCTNPIGKKDDYAKSLKLSVLFSWNRGKGNSTVKTSAGILSRNAPGQLAHTEAGGAGESQFT